MKIKKEEKFKMKSKNSKKTFCKKTLAGFLIFCIFSFSLPQKTQAAWIPGIDPIINQAIDWLGDNIESLVVSAMKTAAINMLNAQINIQMGKGKGGFITNWKTHILTKSRDNANVYFNDYLSQSTKGRGDKASYKSEGYNYEDALKNNASKKVAESNSVPHPTYQGNPTQMTQNDDFLKRVGTYYSGVNPRESFSASASTAREKKYREEKEVAGQEAVANQGFSSTDRDGNVTRPGILNKDSVSNVENISNLTIANAKKIPEALISAVLSKALTMAMQKGFSSLQKKYQADESAKINDQYQQNPGARFQ